MTSISATHDLPFERKPTRPSIITPALRPVSSQASASGFRKLPQSTPAVEVLSGSRKPPQSTSTVEISAEELIKRSILKEMGMDLSDDDDDLPSVPPPAATMLIPPQQHTAAKPSQSLLIPSLRGPGFCNHRYVKGGSKGQVCGKKTVHGRNLCGVHSGQMLKKRSNPAIPSPTTIIQSTIASTSAATTTIASTSAATTINTPLPTSDETTAKLKTLERLVLNLMKNKPVQVTCATQTERKEKNIRARPRSVIQKIRIYKLNPFERYTLIRYSEKGMPICQSKERLYEIVLPNRMQRPIPNGKYALVCHDEKPEMVWKEI